MKISRYLLPLLCTLLLAACGVGTYSVNGGVDDKAYVCFEADDSYTVSVSIDGVKNDTKTIENKTFKKRRNIKQTAQTHLEVAVGSHKVRVERDGTLLYEKTIFVSAGETKIVQL